MSIAICRLLHCFLMQFQKSTTWWWCFLSFFFILILFVFVRVDVARMSHFIHLRQLAEMLHLSLARLTHSLSVLHLIPYHLACVHSNSPNTDREDEKKNVSSTFPPKPTHSVNAKHLKRVELSHIKFECFTKNQPVFDRKRSEQQVFYRYVCLSSVYPFKISKRNDRITISMIFHMCEH